MRLKSTLVCIAIIVFARLSYSQSVMEFQEVKNAGDLKTVYFQIKGLGDDEDSRSELLNNLLSDSNITKGRIFTSGALKTRCQLFVPKNIEPEYIRPILQSYGYDFEFSSVTLDGKLLADKGERIFTSMFYPPADDFPKFVKTGEKAKDIDRYRNSKEEWINSNNRKYNKQKLKGTAEFPIIIPQEQFDSFSEEKQMKILEQSEIFEIK